MADSFVSQSNIFSNDGLTKTRLTLLGATISAFAYGCAVVIHASIIYLRVAEARSHPRILHYDKENEKCEDKDLKLRRHRDLILTVYTSIMFSLVTVDMLESNYLMWKFFPSSLGRPFDDKFIRQEGVGQIGAYMSEINSWMADALLIWRSYVLLQADGRRFQIAVVGVLVSILGAEIGLSLYQLTHLEAMSTGALASLPMFTTLSINILAGGIIVVRLLVHRARIIRVLGPNHGACYAHIAAIILESTLIFVVFEVFFTAVFIAHSPLFNLVCEILGPLHAICSFLVIFRVLQGKAYSAGAQTMVSRRMEFARSNSTASTLTQTISMS